MPGWSNSDRRHRLPADWPKIRLKRLSMDRWLCQWKTDGRICGRRATDVDHVIPNDNHSINNLQSLCKWHHKRKSSSEGGYASAAQKRKNREKFKRVEKHPGLL